MRTFLLILSFCAPVAAFGADIVPLRDGVPCVGGGDRVVSTAASCAQKSASEDAPYLLRTADVTAAARMHQRQRPPAETLRDITFSLSGEGQRWPLPATVELSDAKTSWQWSLAAPQLRRKQTVRVAPGEYRLAFSAPGHQRLERTVKVTAAEARVDLGSLVLAAARIVSGSVIDPERKPLAGCAVLADGVALAFTDARGRFEVDLPVPAPRTVVLNHPEYAPRVMPLVADGDTPLGLVQLARGGSIACAIDRQKIGMKPKISAKLFEFIEGDTFRARGTASLDAEETLISFTNLDPGDYGILLEGTKPGEQLVVPVKVRAGAVSELLVTIAPWRLELTVLYGDDPVGEGKVLLTNSGVLERRIWNAEIGLDASGLATLEMWQRGVIFAEVHAPQFRVFGGPAFHVAMEDEAEEWEIVVPRQRVYGVVVDDATGEPVEGARVIHDSEQIGGETRRTERDGRFSFDALHEGSHTFRVDATSHLPAEPVSVNVTGGSGEQRVDFRLKKTATIPLQVRGADGRAAVAAVVVDNCAAASGWRGFRTDAEGMLALPSTGAAHNLCVLPMQGSFALVDVPAREEAQRATPQPPLQIRVPAPAVAMRVLVKTTSGLPVAQLGLLLVHDGRVVPPTVVDTLAELQRRPRRTDDRGEFLLSGLPAGNYDLYVFTNEEEAFAIAADRRRVAPVYSGYLAPGEALLEIAIERKEP